MTRTPDQAIAHCFNQSTKGPRFDVGMCKRETREAYAVPSDGSRSAAEAWTRTDHRVAPGPVRGALRWYLGGADGHGHVTIDDGKGGEWSVDIKRPGYWDHVPVGTITRTWPNLRYVGTSLDIDGVKVAQIPVAARPDASRLPTVHDLRVALQRLARETKNPDYESLFTDAAMILGEEDAGNHVKVPTTLDGVRLAIVAKEKRTDDLVLGNRLSSAYELIRGL